MKNNSVPRPPTMKRTNVIHKFSCPLSHGNVTTVYNSIGMKTTSLLRHLTAHIYSGSIREHYTQNHNIKID